MCSSLNFIRREPNSLGCFVRLDGEGRRSRSRRWGRRGRRGGWSRSLMLARPRRRYRNWRRGGGKGAAGKARGRFQVCTDFPLSPSTVSPSCKAGSSSACCSALWRGWRSWPWAGHWFRCLCPDAQVVVGFPVPACLPPPFPQDFDYWEGGQVS